MPITKLLLAFISLTSVLLRTSYGAEPPKQKASSANPSPEKKAVHLVVRSRAEIKQTFNYSPFPAIPSELESYGASQVGWTSTYHITVVTQGASKRMATLKASSVPAC